MSVGSLSGAPIMNRIPKRTIKRFTFDGVTIGAQGALTIFNVTGLVFIEALCIRCITSLEGASATIQLGTAGNTAELLGVTTATDIDANDLWEATTPGVGAGPAIVDKQAVLDIIATIAVAEITGGVLEFCALWHPMSGDGHLS